MREFAEAEVVIPDGPFQNRRFRTSRQPYSGRFLDEVDSGRWSRIVSTGPTQSGKTLTCFVIPLLYHLFELKETVICGIPSLDMVKDKWRIDILPSILASRYHDLLPKSGSASRGGEAHLVQFRNGANLRFMTGGGGDKVRAGFTSRVLVITETDGMDESGSASREADKITQLEGRTRAYGDRARVYMECTVSIERGRTWTEYREGSQSRLALRCPHCRAHGTPERKHLVGWSGAPTLLDAEAASQFACPRCGAAWTEEEWRKANEDCLVVHRGQDVDAEGKITGPRPRTNTLGFRWTAANNLLVRPGVVGAEEWKASRATDEDNAEKTMCQQFWAMPSKPNAADLTELDAHVICGRTTPSPRGKVPAGCKRITVGVDCHKRLLYFTAIAWGDDATPHVIDYGRPQVPIDSMAEELALLAALRDLREEVLSKGWASDQGTMLPSAVFVDAGWLPQIVAGFCAESGQGYWPSKGLGGAQDHGPSYREVKQTGALVVKLGQDYHVSRLSSGKFLIEFNADKWKCWLHARIATAMGKAGAFTLYAGKEHLNYAKQLCAEVKFVEFVPGKGETVKWRVEHYQNHWLDTTTLACVAGHLVGERLINDPPAQGAKKPASESPNAFQTPDGRPYMLTER